MAKSKYDRIEYAFREIHEVLKSGLLTRHELEAIKTFGEHLVVIVDKTLARGPVQPGLEENDG